MPMILKTPILLISFLSSLFVFAENETGLVNFGCDLKVTKLIKKEIDSIPFDQYKKTVFKKSKICRLPTFNY